MGADQIVTLVNTESVGAQADVSVLDQFVVERIVGQYLMTTIESVAVNRYGHHRVYVADTDATSVAIRDLIIADDAETSFLWHQVDPMSNALQNDIFGTWNHHGAGQPEATPWMGRLGNIDIKVGRRIDQGSSLIWHTQFEPAPPADNTWFLKLWLRMLVREAT